MNSTNQTKPDHTELPEKPPVVIITNNARFDVGQLAATPGALALLEQHGIGVAALVNRHIHGSWVTFAQKMRTPTNWPLNTVIA